MSHPQSGTDPISKLVSNQLNAWKQDPLIRGGLLYVLDYDKQLELEVKCVGHTPDLSSKQLKVVLLRASERTEGGWSTSDGAVGYSMFKSEQLIAFWLLYCKEGQEPDPLWQDSAHQFEANLSNILQSLQGETPDFNQLVSALPAQTPPPEDKERGLHWESSRSKAPGLVKEELSEKLLLDFKPLF